VRHSAQAFGLAEVVGSGVISISYKTASTRLPLRCVRANRGGIGHHLRHLDTCAVPCVHREEGDVRQIAAHGEGIVGSFRRLDLDIPQLRGRVFGLVPGLGHLLLGLLGLVNRRGLVQGLGARERCLQRVPVAAKLGFGLVNAWSAGYQQQQHYH
jgi:hypothetical protein